MDNSKRQSGHKKHEDLENIFPELEFLLGNSEKSVLENFNKPEKKIYLIVGCARSGSTLLYQYLSKTGYFAYPTNFMSRFYYAPYIGYRLQQALIDFDIKGEIFLKQSDENLFKSTLGKTKGPKEAHEFWYFWNRFFKFKDLQVLSKEEIDSVDWEIFLKELHAMESVCNKPLLMKAMNLNWNLLDLKKKLPNIHFIYLKRDIVYNAQSLYKARLSYFRDDKQWYSFKPPEYESLKKLNPEEQVVEQVLCTNLAIEYQLKQMNSDSFTEISYENFCFNPKALIKKMGLNELINSLEDLSFENNNQSISDNLFAKIENYLNKRN